MDFLKELLENFNIEIDDESIALEAEGDEEDETTEEESDQEETPTDDTNEDEETEEEDPGDTEEEPESETDDGPEEDPTEDEGGEDSLDDESSSIDNNMDQAIDSPEQTIKNILELREYAVALYLAVSSSLESFDTIHMPIDETRVKIIYTVQGKLSDLQRILMSMVTDTIYKDKYEISVQKYIALDKVYSICIKMMEVAFKGINDENVKRNSKQKSK